MLDPAAIRLDGKVAVVTGGGAGIGRGIAEAFKAFGAEVAIWEREDTVDAAASAVGGLGLRLDVRDADAVDDALASTVEWFGSIDILVNNAGGTFRSGLLDTSDGGVAALIDENLGQVIRCTSRVAARMIAAGVAGSIVNLASIEGVRAAPGYAAYGAAKAGVINFTKTAAIELAPHGIRVNALATDVCWTDGLEAMGGAGARERAARQVPLGRTGDVDDLAGAAVFLASDLAAYVTGQTLHVDGGSHAAAGWYRDTDGTWTLCP